MSDYVSAVCAASISEALDAPTRGTQFLVNRKIAQSLVDGRRSAQFTVGDFMAREGNSSPFRSHAEKEAVEKGARIKLMAVAADLETMGYRIDLSDAASRLLITW